MNRSYRLVLLASLLASVACSLVPTPEPTGEAGTPGEPTAPSPGDPGPTEEVTPPPSDVPLPPLATPVSRIVYSDSGDVWVLEEDGSTHQLTSDGGASSVLISGDGARIAYLWRPTPEAHSELRAINADGTGPAALLTAAELDAFYPPSEGWIGTDISQIAFIPGTHRLAFNTYQIPEFIGFIKHDDLWTIDTETAELSPLLTAGEGGDFLFSPDGARTAVITPISVGMINTDGTNHRPDLITFPWVITYSEFLFYPLAVWGSGSGTLGATIPSEDPLADSISGTIWTIPADAGPASAVATIPGNFYFHFWQSSALSPDFNRVAFTRRAGPTDEDLYLAASDGTGEVIYTTGQIDWAGWSPDSTHFAYRTGTPSTLMIGAPGEAPAPIGPGIDLRWVNETEYLYLAGGMGAWTLNRGTVGGLPEILVGPAGDFVSYDFTR